MVSESEWTSLEITKLLVSILTPLLLVYVGYVVSRAARRLENAQWANRKLIERRLELYDEMAPKLNDLYCFFLLIGDFKRISPPAAIQRKRTLDQLFFVNRYLFSKDFSQAYQSFIGTCFLPYSGGIGHAAKILASESDQRSERAETWNEDWATFFTDEARASSREEVKSAYEALMIQFADELDVTPGVRKLQSTPRP